MGPWSGSRRSRMILILLVSVVLLPVLFGMVSDAARPKRRPAAQASLLAAVDAGDVAAMRAAVAAGADVNRIEDDGDSPLTRAATKAGPAALVELLTQGAKPDGTPPRHPTPLMLAMAVPDSGNAAALLKAGADPNRSYRGVAPLVRAACRSDQELVRLLLEAGAEPNGPADGMRRPLIVAVENRDAPVHMVELLLAAGADPDAADASGRTARVAALQIGRADAIAIFSRTAPR